MIQKRAILVPIVAVLFSLFSFNVVRADGKMDYSVALSPTQINVELDPDMSYEGSFSVLNTGLNDIDFTTIINPYQVTNHKYDGDINVHNQYTEIIDWVTFETDHFYIKPDEEAVVKFRVDVPFNAHGGSQYAALGITTNSGPEDGMINAARNISIIFHADISGDIIKGGSILSQQIPGFLLAPPISGDISVENTGNIATDATTIIRVTNALTGAEIYNNSKTPFVNSIYPETIRDIIVKWDDAPRLGAYNVAIATTFLEESSTESRMVFICPIWLICAIIGLIIVFIVIAVAEKRRQSRIKSHGFKFKN